MRGPRLDLLTASAICFASAATSTQAQLTDANATIPSLVISPPAEPVTLYSSLDLPTVDAPFRTFATEPTVHHASPLYRLQKRTPTPGKDLKSSPPVTADAEPFEKKPYTYTIPSARQLQHDKEDALMEYLEISRLPLTAQDEAAKARLKDKLDLANTRWAAVVSKSPRIAKKLEVHHRKKAEEHWEGTNGGINLAAMRRHDAKSIAWEQQGKQWADELKASDTLAKQVMRKHLKIGVMEPPPSRLRKRAPVKDGEGSSGEGVSELLLNYNQDSLPVPLTVKKQAKVAFTPNPLATLHRYVVRKNNPFAPKKNSPKILTYTYRIPDADALRKDLESNMDSSEKDLALAKLAAVEKGDVDAAKKVLNHYEASSKGVYKNGEYDTSNPNFPDVYKNHVIRAEWKGRHASLASERYRRREREKMEKKEAGPVVIIKDSADGPHTSEGRRARGFVHLHKRAPMRDGQESSGNSLNEPLLDKNQDHLSKSLIKTGQAKPSWTSTISKKPLLTALHDHNIGKKAMQEVLKYKHTTAELDALQEDLDRKKGTTAEYLAKAELQEKTKRWPAKKILHLHKRAPVGDREGSSSGNLNEPLLKKEGKASESWASTLLTKPIKGLQERYAREVAAKDAMKKLWPIPKLNVLREDLEEKRGTHEEDIARARVAAIEDGDIDAAKKVVDYHKSLARGVYNKDGFYDKQHPGFPTLYKHHILQSRWSGHHDSLLGDKNAREYMERLQREKTSHEPKARKVRQELLNGATSHGGQAMDSIHLHKRAPMHNGVGSSGNGLNEPHIKKEEGSSQSSWAATLMKPITNWQEQAAREKAANYAMNQKYEFPTVKALVQDLEAKKGKPGEDIARAKLAAVADEDLDAARKVVEHHHTLSQGVHDKKGHLNNQHPDFPSFYDHHIQRFQWKEHHDVLLGEKNARDFLAKIRQEYAEKEAKAKKEREELLQGSSQTSKHKPGEGSAGKGGQTKVLERVHLHKRAPARDPEISSGSEPLLSKEPTGWKATLAKPFQLMQDKYQEYVAKGEAKAAEKVAKGKNVAQALRYRYQIPNVDQLREDYEKKAGGRTRQEVLSQEEWRRATASLQQPRYGKDYIAMARLSAIEDGNALAAREVYLHHTAKSKGLFNKDGLYNTDHPQFASLYKNKIKAHRWEHTAGRLAAIEVGRSQVKFREKRKAAEERLKKEGKGMLYGRGAALAPDHKAVGQNRAGSEPMAIHLHKRAPMHIGHSRPVDENGEVIVKHEPTGSLAMTNAAVEDGKNSIKNTVSVHGHAMAKTDKVMDHTQSAASAFVDKTADPLKKSSGKPVAGEGTAEKPKRWEDITYSIPPLNELMDDMQRKVDDHSRISEGHDEQLKAQRAYKVAVARDRVEAVALGNPIAAGRVEQHNGHKVKAILPTVKTAGDKLNSDHPDFLTFHKNYLKHTAWAELRENLTPKKEEKSGKGQEKPMSGAMHLHKRAPMFSEKGASSKVSAKKAVPWEHYKYEIPPAEHLHQDLLEKEKDLRTVNEGEDEELKRHHTNKVAIAKDRIDAVENGNPEAARRVQDHHGRKRQRLTASVVTNDGFNTEHASFPSFHKNHWKNTEWEQLQIKLAFEARQKKIHSEPPPGATQLHKRHPMLKGNDVTAEPPTKKAVPWQEYHYEIPSAADLEKDLHKKGKDLRRVNEGDDEELKRQHTSKVAVAQDRLDAVDNRNPDAAKRVQDHHEHKQEALATSIQSSQDPNSKHPGVHSFVKNYLKQLEWEDLQKDLAGEKSRKNMHSEPEPEAETKANALYKRAPMLSGEESSDEDAAIEPLIPVEEPKTMSIGKKASYSIPPKEVLVQDAAKKQEDLRRVMKGINPMEKQYLMNKEYLARARVAAVVKGHSGAAGVVHSHHGSKAKGVFHQLDQIDDPNFGTFHKNGKKAVVWGALRKDLEKEKSKAGPSNEMMHRQ